MPVKIFFCYAHEDERLRKKLEKQLRTLKRQGLIEVWHDRNISAGTQWQREIDQHLNTAHIILLLVSPDFMDSDYSYAVEMKRAIERHERGEARVIPIIIRPVDWQSAPFGKYQALPKNDKPVTMWQNRDAAFLDVARGIREVVEEIRIAQAELQGTSRPAMRGDGQENIGRNGVSHIIPTKGDFHSFLQAFITALEHQDYAAIGATTQPGFLLYCNNAVTPSEQVTWNATHRLLSQGALQFSFPQPVQVFRGRTQCFVPGYGAASEIVNAVYSQDGSFKSVAPGGMAQLVFIDKGVGNNTFEWFWMTAILNAAC